MAAELLPKRRGPMAVALLMLWLLPLVEVVDIAYRLVDDGGCRERTPREEGWQ